MRLLDVDLLSSTTATCSGELGTSVLGLGVDGKLVVATWLRRKRWVTNWNRSG